MFDEKSHASHKNVAPHLFGGEFSLLLKKKKKMRKRFECIVSVCCSILRGGVWKDTFDSVNHTRQFPYRKFVKVEEAKLVR